MMCVIATSEERSIQDDMTRNAEVSEDIVTKLAPNFELKLREELDFFRLSLTETGRSTVGGTSLSSGTTLDLVDQVVRNIHLPTLRQWFKFSAEDMPWPLGKFSKRIFEWFYLLRGVRRQTT